MEKVLSNYNFTVMENCLDALGNGNESHSLITLKNELNKFFYKAKCREVMYTKNTDNLFFGMRVYPVIDGNTAVEIVGDSRPKPFEAYYVEVDSKLCDPMLALTKREKTAILLHEVGHIVYDIDTIDAIKAQMDMYFAETDEYMDMNMTKGYKELLAYAIKDSVIKAGSLFAKIGNTEIVADTFAVSCGYGPDLESAMRKISTSSAYIGKSADNRFLALAWVLRIRKEFDTSRIPVVRTLNKAKEMSGSKLEKREIAYATTLVNRADFVSEGNFIDDIKARFSKKFNDFKVKGIRGIKNDTYELSLRLRTAECVEDLMYIIRQANTNIAILQDYLSEDIPEIERKEINDTLLSLYDIRQKAAKEQAVRDRNDSLIQVYYPEVD